MRDRVDGTFDARGIAAFLTVAVFFKLFVDPVVFCRSSGGGEAFPTVDAVEDTGFEKNELKMWDVDVLGDGFFTDGVRSEVNDRAIFGEPCSFFAGRGGGEMWSL